MPQVRLRLVGFVYAFFHPVFFVSAMWSQSTLRTTKRE